MVQFFRDLKMMVNSLMRSGTSLFWSFVLLCLHIYLFALFLTYNVADHFSDTVSDDLRSGGKLRDMFGSIFNASYTLFSAMTGGRDWNEISDALYDVHPSNSYIFCFFIFFTSYALTNIIVGIFVDSAMECARSDKDEVIRLHFRNRTSALCQIE